MLREDTSAIEPKLSEAEMLAEIERLSSRNAELERSSEDLERFVFAASHDLREPLRTISSYAQLFGYKYGGSLDGDATLFLTNIKDGAARIGEVLSDLMAYASVTALHETPEPVDLNIVVENVKENLKASIAESQASITSDVLPSLSGRYTDFISLFQNLLSNAIKYRVKSAPKIHISICQDHGELKFAVSDNGIGIDPCYHEYVFEPFKRLSRKNVPGTGLGLAICQRVVNRYAGRIWVESQEGQGSRFIFALPEDNLQVDCASRSYHRAST